MKETGAPIGVSDGSVVSCRGRGGRPRRQVHHAHGFRNGQVAFGAPFVDQRRQDHGTPRRIDALAFGNVRFAVKTVADPDAAAAFVSYAAEKPPVGVAAKLGMDRNTLCGLAAQKEQVGKGHVLAGLGVVRREYAIAAHLPPPNGFRGDVYREFGQAVVHWASMPMA